MPASRATPNLRGTLVSAARGLRALLAAIGLLTVTILVTPLDRWWAHAYAGSMDQPRGDVLVVLSAARDDAGVISYSSYWRARYALLAWRAGPWKHLIVSGSGAEGICAFLVAQGVPRAAIVTETRSETTRENALNTAFAIRSLPGTKVLLTSDFHMYRAIRVFRKLGMEPTPYPAPDVLKQSQHWYGRLSGFQTLVMESAKIIDYRLHGWI